MSERLEQTPIGSRTPEKKRFSFRIKYLAATVGGALAFAGATYEVRQTESQIGHIKAQATEQAKKELAATGITMPDPKEEAKAVSILKQLDEPPISVVNHEEGLIERAKFVAQHSNEIKAALPIEQQQVTYNREFEKHAQKYRPSWTLEAKVDLAGTVQLAGLASLLIAQYAALDRIPVELLAEQLRRRKERAVKKS